MNEIECLICGYIGEAKKIKLTYKGHWLKGLFLCDEICPVCGDTAIEEVNWENIKGKIK